MPKGNWIEFNQSNLNTDPKHEKPLNQQSKKQAKVQKVKNAKKGKNYF